MGSYMAYSTYKFTPFELEVIHDMLEESEFGLPKAFRWYKGLKNTDQIRTGDVEDFAISFYTQYNRECRRIY